MGVSHIKDVEDSTGKTREVKRAKINCSTVK